MIIRNLFVFLLTIASSYIYSAGLSYDLEELNKCAMTVKTLNAKCKGWFEKSISEAVRNVPVEDHEALLETFDALTTKMGALNKLYSLECIVNVPSKYYSAYENAVNDLTAGMDEFYKSCYIQALSRVNPKKYKSFVRLFKDKSAGMSEQGKIAYLLRSTQSSIFDFIPCMRSRL